MEDSVKISILLELYGKLLTEKQYRLLDDYYNNDLGLSEIAENEGITRQAVRDNLKKGENNLLEYEEKIGLLKKFEMQKNEINNILEELENLKLNSEEKKKLKNITKKLKNLL
jgi:predicted DNA-binding protein YlxM (UPF0122 family)